ncbi:hypothetical protein ACIREM_42525 [Streptomyces shenzhenensis]|uniref:hypothetical protein n=1 Tax=Streptomyces shenzhenensis TaxID=943815 RepID=UPI0038234A92
MAKPDTHRLDRAIRETTSKLEAVLNREMWPLDGRERRTVLAAHASGSYRITRGRSTSSTEQRIDAAWSAPRPR